MATRGNWAKYAAIGAGVFLFWACGSGTTPPKCSPGQSIACIGPGQCAGWQVCLADGSYGACDCGMPAQDAAPTDAFFPDASDGGTPADTGTPGMDAEAGPPVSAPWADTFGAGWMTGVAVDANKNVILGGHSVFLLKRDAAGNPVWTKNVAAGAQSIGVDPQSAIYAAAYGNQNVDFGAGPSGAGAYIVKYDSNGQLQWQYGPFADAVFFSLVIRPNGNIVAVGWLNGSNDFGGGTLTSSGGADILLVEITNAKAHVFSKRWGDASGQYALAAAVDANNNVFVSGTFEGQLDFGGGTMTAQKAVFMAKLGGSNQFLQQMRTAGTVSNTNVSSLSTDAAGRLWFTGRLYMTDTVDFGGGSLVSAGDNDVLLGLLDPQLGHVFSKSFGDVNWQSGGGVAVDPKGNGVFVGGYSGGLNLGLGPLPSGDGYYIATFDPTGKILTSRGAAASGGSASAAGVAYLTDPDAVVIGSCGGTLSLPSGVLTCGNSVVGFAARMPP